ncbi:MAG: class I SAM-dependent methyltransferase [Bacteroidia bacterium]
MKEIWDERYSKPEYAYGELPNEYLKAQLPGFPVGKILFPAEGEGRNAVYAAGLGWQVSAFDMSMEGKKKALALAKKQGVDIDYKVGEFEEIDYLPEQFDAIALIYAHFPADKKEAYYKKLATYLRKGGIVIFEAFSKNHLQYNAANPKVGGPKDIDMLFSEEEIRDYFNNFEIKELQELETELHEGIYHNGKGSVIRFTGRKK